MNNFNDDNIKKIIKDHVKDPKINLTSQEILARFDKSSAKHAVRRSWFAIPSVKVGLGFVATALVIGTFIYLNRDLITPPIGSSDNTSVVPSSDYTSLVDREPEKIPGGKEGEFVFMSFSATSFIGDDDLDLTLFRARGNNHDDDERGHGNNSEVDRVSLEAVLDETMPLVDDFYALDSDFNYQKLSGDFSGEFGRYPAKYVIDETTYILANVAFEEDEEESETEIEGEIIISDQAYRYRGKTEFDFEDNETDIELKIDYSEQAYLEIKSENKGEKQEFEYQLTDGDEQFIVKIETFRHGNQHMRFVETEVSKDGETYQFIIGKEEGVYHVNYERLMILITKDEMGNYIYSY